jgi:predicted ester cyclase
LEQRKSGIYRQEFAEDLVNNSPTPGQPANREGVKWVISNIRKALADLHFTIEDMIAEGNEFHPNMQTNPA